MKKFFAMACAATFIQGCADVNNAVSRGVSSATNGVINPRSVLVSGGASSSPAAGGAPSGSSQVQYHVGSESINWAQATKASRNIGKIQITRTEKNPTRQTQLVLDSCKHPRIGDMQNCYGAIYEISPEGWLINKVIHFGRPNNPLITLAAGNYYMKFQNSASTLYYAAGEFSVTPFVTNYVAVELE